MSAASSQARDPADPLEDVPLLVVRAHGDTHLRDHRHVEKFLFDWSAPELDELLSEMEVLAERDDGETRWTHETVYHGADVSCAVGTRSGDDLDWWPEAYVEAEEAVSAGSHPSPRPWEERHRFLPATLDRDARPDERAILGAEGSLHIAADKLWFTKGVRAGGLASNEVLRGHLLQLRMCVARPDALPALFDDLVKDAPELALESLEKGIGPAYGDGRRRDLLKALGPDALVGLLSHENDRIRGRAFELAEQISAPVPAPSRRGRRR